MFEEHYSGHFWRPAYVFIYSVWFMCLLYEVMLHGYAYDSNLLAAKRSTLFVETEAILSDTGEQLDFKWWSEWRLEHNLWLVINISVGDDRSCSYWRWTTFVLWNSLFWRDPFALLLTISGFSFLGLSVLIFWSCQVSQSGSPLFQWPWTLGGNLLLALRSAGWHVRWIQNMLPNLKWIFAELWQVSLWIDVWFGKLLTCKCCWKRKWNLCGFM